MHAINITVDAERRASAPIGAALIANNSDYQLTFSIDPASGFDLTAPISCIFVTARGALPPVPFAAGGFVTPPALTHNDGVIAYVGLTQGEIKTTTPARLALLLSIYSKAGGREAEPEPGPVAPPIVTDVTLDDLLLISDVEQGRQVLITLQTLADALSGSSSGGVFRVVCEVTPHAEILEAFDAQQLPVMDIAGERFVCTEANAHYAVFFSPTNAPSLKFWTVTSANVWTANEYAITDSETFTATYGSTSLALIRAAYTEGRLVKMTHNGLTYICTACDAAGAVFAGIADDFTAVKKIDVSASGAYNESAPLNFFGDVRENDEGFVTGGAVYEALSGKQDTLEIDEEPEAGSANPVSSGGVFSAISECAEEISALQDNADELAAAVAGKLSGAEAALVYELVVIGSSVTCDANKIVVIINYQTQRKILFVEYVDASTANQYTLTRIDAAGLHLICDTGDTIRRIVLSGTTTLSGTLTIFTPTSAPKYTTLTLAVADWTASGTGYACTKTVPGMTANSIVLLTFSDTETNYEYTQTTNALTFTASASPSAAVTVNVAFQEGVAL